MSPKKLILLAFVLSVIVAGIIYVILTGFLSPKPTPVTETKQYVNVVVAAVDIPERTRINKDMVKTVRVPAEIAPQSAIRSADDAVGKTAYTKIMKEDVLTTQKISGGEAGFTGMIPSDTRAITIPLNDITGVAGFAKPGDYVDIYLVSEKAYKNAIYGKLVVQNVLLLAINKSSDTGSATVTNTESKGDPVENQGKKPQAAQQNAGTMTMATIAVTPADVLKIAAAEKEGTLYIALRPDRPEESYAYVPDYFQYMASGKEEQANQQQQAPRAAAPAQQPIPYYSAPAPAGEGSPSVSIAPEPSNNVEVIRGNSVSRVNVR